AAMAGLVEAFRRRADSLTGRVVASLKLPLARTGDQHRLGSMIAEARRNVLRTELGLVTNSSIRADLPGGRITYGQLFEVHPSQNRLVKLTVSGSQLKELLEHALEGGKPSAHIAGARVRYDPQRRPGQRVQGIELLGRKFRREGRYTLAADDFLAAGGEGYTMLVGLPAEPAPLLDVDGLVTYLRRLPQPADVTARPGFLSR
ncbi:MAG TPA: 5'-nucleotidase, partial [Gemmatimonadales bacterium]